ncbi:uncharacterized protein LOC100372056 [Saccoglossus kowalevskii]|uniref:Uncharacterized protein LOC100372056 n=1 Tax=Saccoglossus kowalevskii TaxID=10224 RepID=A0ABM0GJW5_SACKO|nr:PREDICTED: uncharacterized protein LOC100372056 [Saccoglossus kowalevskii]
MTAVHPEKTDLSKVDDDLLELDDYEEDPHDKDVATTSHLPPYESNHSGPVKMVQPREPTADAPPVVTAQPQSQNPLPQPGTAQTHAPVQPTAPMQGPGYTAQNFSPAMYNPFTANTIQELASTHKSRKQLEDVLNTNAKSSYQAAYQQYSSQHNNLSYDQLLQTLIFDGEELLMGGQYIYYTSVTFLDPTGKFQSGKPAMTRGRAFLTSRRLLLLSAEEASASDITEERIGKTCNTYHLTTSMMDSMYLQSLPMEGFRSVDLNASVGVKTKTTVRGNKPECSRTCGSLCICFKPCCTCCEIESCMKQWSADIPSTQVQNERYVTIGTLIPPWAERMMVKIHFEQSMQLNFINNFLVEMQRHSPNIYKLDMGVYSSPEACVVMRRN